jgi:hypothetical protein
MTDSLISDTPAIPEIDPDKNYLAELVGEGKKFNSPEDLARGKYEADAFIRMKNAEYDKLREDYLNLHEQFQARASMEQLVDRLSTAQPQNRENTDADNKPAYDPREIESLISSKYQEFETQKTSQQNFRLVQDKLQERYGANYSSIVKQQIDNLGLTKEFVDDLARKHPQVLLKTLGVYDQPATENFQSPARSSVRSDHFAPQTPKRDWAYYENLRKNSPAIYTDPKTQLQMHEDAKANPAAFGII